MAGIAPGHFVFRRMLISAAAQSLRWRRQRCSGRRFSRAVMLRMVTRRLTRLGPSVCSLRYCSP